MMNILLLVDYAMQFVGRPYRWGGDDPMSGFDCSGFVQELLAAVGEDPPSDQSSQALYDHFAKGLFDSSVEMGSLLFFGKSVSEITHVAFALNEDLMIEAAGGGSKTLTLDDAVRQNAYIRMRPIFSRRDLVAAIRPVYRLEKAPELADAPKDTVST